MLGTSGHFQGGPGSVLIRKSLFFPGGLQATTLCLLTRLLKCFCQLQKDGALELQSKSLTPSCPSSPASGISQAWSRTAMQHTVGYLGRAAEVSSLLEPVQPEACSHPFPSALACPPLPSCPRQTKNVVFLRPYFTATLFYAVPPKYLE